MFGFLKIREKCLDSPRLFLEIFISCSNHKDKVDTPAPGFLTNEISTYSYQSKHFDKNKLIVKNVETLTVFCHKKT